MNRILSTAAKVTALAFAISSGIDAQRITRRESHGEVRNMVTASTVVAAIGNTSRINARVDGLSLSSDRVRVVDVRPYVRTQHYSSALSKNAEQIEILRQQLVTIEPVFRMLAEHRPSLTVDDVVAAGILDVIETGKSVNVLVLYVDNRNRIGVRSTTSGALATFRPSSASLLSALRVSPEMVARVSGLESMRLDRVRFYDIDAILKPADSLTYRSAIRQNETSIRSLRSELSKRPLVMQAMTRHDDKLLLGDIFAADILGNDDVLVLYYKRRVAREITGGT